jgi:hypothetical protein
MCIRITCQINSTTDFNCLRDLNEIGANFIYGLKRCGVRIKINPGLELEPAYWPHRRGVDLLSQVHGPRREKAEGV